MYIRKDIICFNKSMLMFCKKKNGMYDNVLVLSMILWKVIFKLFEGFYFNVFL